MISNKIRTVLTILCVCLMQIGVVKAQDKKIEKANEVYNKFAFIEAGKLYKNLVEKGNNSLEVYTKLGNCYYFNGQYPEAADSYSKVFNSGQAVDSEFYFRYAQALNNTKKYNEANVVMKKYYAMTGKKDLSENWKEQKLMADIQKESGRYNFKPVNINTPVSDFGTAFDGKDKVLFASARDTGVVIKRKHSWNEKSFMKIYSAKISTDGGLEDAAPVKGDINTKYHQSSAVVTKDGKYMYFTRNNFIDGKLGADRNGTNYLKIYVAENVKGEWKNVKELPYPINSDGFSSGHPALSPDETQLYFASDRNNSFGNSDLYVVSLKKGALVGNDVTKLSDEINTPGRETYPYMDGKGILYFASDGHPGLGGLDVFAAMKDAEGKYHVVNVGDGVNTGSDDFAYTINADSKKGYFSSNRDGNDNIYSFTENKPVIFDFDIRSLIFGTITENGKPVAGFNVQMFNSNDESIGTTTTDNAGNYKIAVDPYQNYRALYTKTSYADKTVNTEQLKPLEKKEISFEITKEMEVVVDGEKVKIKDGDDLTQKLKLNPIYFDLNGYNIRQSSKKELNKVVALMKDRPNITIKVNSYTDSRGRDEFNMKLSENRAKATVDYIVNSGIAQERISGEGFGETNLLNHCSNGVNCSEKEHELNRRSEFIINFK
ncbi:OmpA family protein [Flavobacterium tyrosinilyticum]|uniref:OmpA family protein n=1 Tax=Flavobacterium tyrosinilyticum TaxID=1658740 RepID=UPI00202FD0ED|nr:OmpA family protein [Flavobacterium tyrosinilyticum]MCM0667681.1 OmpA family protein [Flavobacterium tyrosinilyticum]